MNGLIQGKDAILCFDKNGFIPFVCASDISLSLASDELPIRTKTASGKGHWKKVTYQNASYSISLSGLLKFDNASNFSGWDLIDNWFHFAHVRFRIAFTDDQSNTRSLQGEAMVRTTGINTSAGALVKNDFELSGNGELMIFDGLIPCDSSILTITITGQTAADGIVHIAYTYSGSPYQVKYRIDGTGNYVYALIDQPIDIPSLALGAHSVEVIPVCNNDYEGVGATQDFEVTQSLTCVSAITDITITPTSATPVFTGPAVAYFYVIDGGLPGYVPNILTPASIGGLSVGAHTILMTPVCANGLTGTGFTKAFTVASQPAQSIINYSFISWKTGNTFYIYVNGILNINESVTGASGNITVPTGATVKGVLVGNNTPGSACTLQTTDNTISSVIDNRSGTAPVTLQFTFIANGDTYTFFAQVTP